MLGCTDSAGRSRTLCACICAGDEQEMPRLVLGCVVSVRGCVICVSEGVLLVCLHMRRRRARDAPPGDRVC